MLPKTVLVKSVLKVDERGALAAVEQDVEM